ncbi:MAG: AsnC family transcriptional regulator [Thaumarchaeota archaeon]|nr:AsnC family transcriptional regulator [Nitrososphaerota archaeon]
MDELDVKIFRALMSESTIGGSGAQFRSNLKTIASRLGADDSTVWNRYKRLRESGAMSGWQLMINPTFFACRMGDIMVDVEPESAKADMIRKLKLVENVIMLMNFYGRVMKIYVVYNSDESYSRTVELISRITNAEKVTKARMALPSSETERLTETDVAIIRALSKEAHKSYVLVAKELGLSTKTVKKRVDRLRKENTIFALPSLNVGRVRGLIPVLLSYAYSKDGAKGTVDRAITSHFEGSYLWAGYSDPENGFVMLSASSMVYVQEFLEWAKLQPGIVSARVDIPTEQFSFPEKLMERLEGLSERRSLQRVGSFRAAD